MTREERVDWLCRLRCWVVAPSLMTAEQKSKFIEALTETIEALQTEQNIYKEGYKSCKRIMAREKQFNSYCPKCMGKLELCEDAISRAEAMNAVDGLYLDGESAQGFTTDANEDCLIGKYKAIEILDELPSVQPEPKTGHWITRIDDKGQFIGYKCSKCGGKKIGDEGEWVELIDYKYQYCPNCGAKMEVGE